jgi:hypothetical protein
MDIEILFTSSKTLESKLREITFDIYKIYSVPTIRESLSDTHESLLLKFSDVWKNGQISSNPEKEGDYILSLLSLILQMKIEFDSTKINNVQGTVRRKRSSFLNGKIEFPSDFKDLFEKLYSLNIDVLRQYLRSCSTYRTALSLIDDNPMLSFFLLVTAIEAISNKIIEAESIKQKFIDFILKYIPKSFEEELGHKELLVRLINQAYHMRSAFTHGGTEISLGTLSADDLGRNYVKHYIAGKEVYSPSLMWFEKVVHATLLEFLRTQKVEEKIEPKLSNLAIEEEAIINVKVTKAIEAGRIVTTKDVDLDFCSE